LRRLPRGGRLLGRLSPRAIGALRLRPPAARRTDGPRHRRGPFVVHRRAAVPTGPDSPASEDGFASGDADNRPRHVARGAGGGEEDVRPRALAGLTGTTERGVAAELLELLSVLRCGLQRRPDGPGRHSVDPDVPLAQLTCEVDGEIVERRL